MKIIVTGASGMLGQDLIPILSEDEVLPVDITGDCLLVDITNQSEVRSCVGKHTPDVLIHCAAFTNVDGCQTDPETAWKVNAAGTWHLAEACREFDAVMMYISTDFVFDGTKGSPYDEFDTPNPVSIYGRTKYAGEVFVKQLAARHYIVRTAWLYGAKGKSFPGTMIKVALEGKPLRVVGDQVGSPTYTKDLSEAISRIIRQPFYGTYHVTNSGECSWYDFARLTLELYGLNEPDLSKITSEEWPTPTKRPEYSVLEHRAMKLAGLPEMRPWEKALEDFIREIKAS